MGYRTIVQQALSLYFNTDGPEVWVEIVPGHTMKEILVHYKYISCLPHNCRGVDSPTGTVRTHYM